MHLHIINVANSSQGTGARMLAMLITLLAISLTVTVIGAARGLCLGLG
jgi:hypothetical protein